MYYITILDYLKTHNNKKMQDCQKLKLSDLLKLNSPFYTHN